MVSPRPVQTCRASAMVPRLRKRAGREMGDRFRGRAGRRKAPQRPRKNLLAAASGFSVGRTPATHEHARHGRDESQPRQPSTSPAPAPKRATPPETPPEAARKRIHKNGPFYVYDFDRYCPSHILWSSAFAPYVLDSYITNLRYYVLNRLDSMLEIRNLEELILNR